MMAQASTLVLFNKKLRILPINVGRANVQNSLDFLPHFQLIGTSEDACAIVGAVVDSMASEATSKKLENNEKNMKSIILGGE